MRSKFETESGLLIIFEFKEAHKCEPQLEKANEKVYDVVKEIDDEVFYDWPGVL